MKSFQLNETKNLTLSLYDGSIDKFVRAYAYDSGFNLYAQFNLLHVQKGIYVSAVNLPLGKFHIYYDVFTDSAYLNKSSSYICGEDLISITPNNNERIDELYKLQGLDILSPVVVTTSRREVGGITQIFTGDGVSTSTVTRV
jgi:hypothetical protein